MPTFPQTMPIIATLLLTPVAGAQATAAHGPPLPRPVQAATSSQPISPEESLWQQIVTLRTEPATTQPFAAWFEEMLRQRRVLLERTQLYLALYPGGAHQLDAVQLELATLYELAALQGGAFEPLHARVQELLRDGRSDSPAVWEAAYWNVLCERFRRGAAATQPASAPVLMVDDEALAAYREYVRSYPRSPHVPRMADLLFAHALASEDRAEMQRLVDVLRANFPDHAITAALAAQWQREQAVGRAFWLMYDEPGGQRVDTRAFVGQPVLIVVWAASDAVARDRARAVERFRQEHPEVRVVGVNVDGARAEMTAACEELGLSWPQFHDGLGLANRFAREWGVRRVPRVFVIDRAGRLAGSTEDERWERLARAALAEGGR